MVFNGHTVGSIDEIDEELFTDIQVMYADGVLGGRAVYEANAPLTAAVFNYFRSPGTTPFKPDHIFPWVYEYSVNPDTEPLASEQVNESLLAFMTQAPGFEMARFKNVG